MAYTSVSTALNQKLSEKVKASAPTNPLPKMAMALLLVISAFLPTNLPARLVMVQKVNKTAKALETMDTALTMSAILVSSPKANMAKKAPIICNSGAPGGCPTCNFAEVEIYSPASQKLPVGSTVRAYTIKAMAKETHPRMVSHFLKSFANIVVGC